MMLTDGLKGGMVTHSTDVKGRPFLGSGLCGDHSHGLQWYYHSQNICWTQDAVQSQPLWASVCKGVGHRKMKAEKEVMQLQAKEMLW